MELSAEVGFALNNAMAIAAKEHYDYITPETLLLVLCHDADFALSFEACGGNTKLLESDLFSYLEEYVDKSDEGAPEMSEGALRIMTMATQSAFNSGCNEVCVRHLVHAIWLLPESYAVYYMRKQDITEVELLEELTYLADSAEDDNTLFQTSAVGAEPDEATGSDSSWRQYTPCLNDTIKDENPLIGRETELERTIQILCRKDKNNPLHIGEPGVGKTAITHGLVRLIMADKVPEPLKGARIFALDLGGMIAGTQFRGDFEKRLKTALTNIGREDKPIVYIDEIHNLVGAGATSGGSLDASNILKPYLADGHIRFIGATTFEEYKKYFEKNKSLIRRFQNVEISEPGIDETIKILDGLKSKYEEYHGVKYAKGLMEYAAQMSAKYINERFLPDKAIDLIDEAGSFRKLHPTEKKTQTVDKAVINEVLTKICRVPVETVETDDLKGLATLEKRLKKCVFGQDEAIDQVVNAVKYSKAGLSENDKPLASLLFVGPTGVGKTEIARTLAKELGVKLVRFDMSEYIEKHAVAKLIGSPAGYVGYEEGGLLTEAIRKSPSCVLLLDEIEKAHGDIYNVLLQVMDYATLTDNQGRKADFRNVILIMTSNAGADKVGKGGIGFESVSRNSGAIMDEVKRLFRPEFRNRLNKTVVFNSMDDAMASRIVDKKLSEMEDQLSVKNIVLSVSKEAIGLVKKRGISPEFGARQMERVLRNDIKPLFVDEILFGKLKKGGLIKLSVRNGEFVITVSKNRSPNKGYHHFN